MEPKTLEDVFFILDDMHNPEHWKVVFVKGSPPLTFIHMPRADIHQPGQWADAWG